MSDPQHHAHVVAFLAALAERAAATVMAVYNTPFSVEFKGPRDPVTLADKRANELVVTALQKEFPGVPIVAEESPKEEYAGFASADRAFFVDPVDGTNEFVHKSGEFCIMLGYVEHGLPVLGVIDAPALGLRFEGVVGRGATVVARDGSSRVLGVSPLPFAEGLAVVSRSHRSEATDAALDRLGIGSRVQYGSAGLKAMRVADGSALVYLHSGYAGARWDAAAPEAIARAAGASYTDIDGARYRYDDTDLANSRGILAVPAHRVDEALALLRGEAP